MKRYKWSECGMVEAKDGVYIRRDVEIVFDEEEVKDKLMGAVVRASERPVTPKDLEHLAYVVGILR